MSINSLKPTFRTPTTYTPRFTGDTLESKQIRKLSFEVEKINNETNFIKEHNKLPPQTPNFYRQLDTY